MIPYGIEVSNFRSLADAVSIPFSRKMTFLTGPNNVGKSNVLMALAIIANKATRKVAADDLPAKGGLSFSLTVPASTVQQKLAALPLAVGAHKESGYTQLEVPYSMHSGGIDRVKIAEDRAIEQFPNYFHTRAFQHEFGQSSSRIADNANMLLDRLNLLEDFKGSTYVPHLRFITRQNEEPPRFLAAEFPGETIAFGSVIARLAELDRPSPSQRQLRAQLLKIEAFMAHCLERKKVSIEVAHDKSAIVVDIDGEQRSLVSLGTGVEQLLMIGLAALGFSEKLVLIDEPELHLHPRAQKRMLQYLNDSADARFVIATHSAAALDAVDADVIQITRDNAVSKARTIRSNSDRYHAIRDLGHSPSELLQTRFAVWVEGPSDRIYLKNWISRIDDSLVEGVDYTILYYGGSVLAQHSFVDDDDPSDEIDLVRALSLARSFAVIIDSDTHANRPALRDTKIRIQEEVGQAGGYCWITEGREVENYISVGVQKVLASEFSYATAMTEKTDQILDPKKAKKVVVAKRAVELDDGEWPLDLQAKITELVRHITAAR